MGELTIIFRGGGGADGGGGLLGGDFGGGDGYELLAHLERYLTTLATIQKTYKTTSDPTDYILTSVPRIITSLEDGRPYS